MMTRGRLQIQRQQTSKYQYWKVTLGPSMPCCWPPLETSQLLYYACDCSGRTTGLIQKGCSFVLKFYIFQQFPLTNNFFVTLELQKECGVRFSITTGIKTMYHPIQHSHTYTTHTEFKISSSSLLPNHVLI